MNKLMVIFTAVFLALQLAPSDSSASGERELAVTGVLITVTGEFIEVKRGNREYTLYFGETTAVNDPQGATAAAGSLELCQTVSARYVRQGDRNVLVNVRIVNAGGCYRN